MCLFYGTFAGQLTYVVLPLLTACSDFEATVAIFRVGNVVSGC